MPFPPKASTCQPLSTSSNPPSKQRGKAPVGKTKASLLKRPVYKGPPKMATQEELQAVVAEMQAMKMRLEAAENLVQQQATEISTLTETVTRLEAKAKPAQSASSPSRRKLIDRNTASAQPNRRSSIHNSRVIGTSDKQRLAPTKSYEAPARRSQPAKARHHPSSARQKGTLKTKEAIFDKESSILRLYLRGRAVILPAPINCGDSFDMKHPVDAPAETLKLEWAHGFKNRQLLLLPTGELVYACAALVVLFQPTGNASQRFYAEHTDDVKCLALHPDKVTMASGQVAGHDKEAGKPHIRIWNSVTLQTLRVLGLSNDGSFDRAVGVLSFSKADSGNYLAAVDESNEHVLSIWQWSTGQKLGDTRVSTEALLGMEFNPTANEPPELATWGRFGLIWWTVSTNQGTPLNTKQAVKIARLKQATFDVKDRPRAVTCAAFTPDGSLLIAGDTNGALSWWTRGSTRMGRLLPGAHSNGAISSVFVSPDNDWLMSTGARDYSLTKWNIKNEPPTQLVKVPMPLGTTVRAIQYSGNAVYLGTSNGSILSTDKLEDVNPNLQPVIQGHSEEVWGVSTHPTNSAIAVTVGYDSLLVVWNVVQHRRISVRQLPSPAHCVIFHPSGTFAAVGLQTGEWLVADLTEDLAESVTSQQSVKSIYSDHPAREQIECMAFSPDGKYVAAGSRDQHVYVYSVAAENSPPTFARVSRCSGHASYITHVDWSTDSKYLRTNSGDYELLFWEALTGRQVLIGSISQEQEDKIRDPSYWATHTCTLTFAAAGIWPDGADGTDVNCVDKANNKDIIAIGDDFGKVRLFRWPCSAPRSHNFTASGHSSHVTNAIFVNDDSRLITSGGRDCSIIQWSVVNG